MTEVEEPVRLIKGTLAVAALNTEPTEVSLTWSIVTTTGESRLIRYSGGNSYVTLRRKYIWLYMLFLLLLKVHVFVILVVVVAVVVSELPSHSSTRPNWIRASIGYTQKHRLTNYYYYYYFLLVSYWTMGYSSALCTTSILFPLT